MPTVKEFETSQGKRTKKKPLNAKAESMSANQGNRRRPGMENKTMNTTTETTVNENTDNTIHASASDTDAAKTKIEFTGSDYLRAKMPKAFEIAERVADEWKADGNFEDVPVPNAYAKKAVTLGLQKAKELEKKLEEKGVISGANMLARTGLEFVKSKLNKKH